MKYNFRNLLMVTIGASYLVIPAQLATAETATEVPAKHKRKEGAAPTAASLVAEMRKAVAFIAKSAKDKISTKSKEARPFWSALKDSSKALDSLESGLKAKDATMLKGLDALGRSLPQLSASWGVLRGGHEGLQVGRGVIALSKAYDMYLSHFGPAAARKKKGGEITAGEKAKLVKSRAEVAKLKTQLTALKSKAKPKSYELRLIVDLIILCDALAKDSGNDLKAYTTYIYQFDRLSHTVGGYGAVIEVWYPDYYKEWTEVGNSYAVMALEYTVDAYAYYEGWDYSSEAVSNYGDYYEVTAAVSSISTTEVSTFESYTEEYSEVSATEESEEEAAEINEEVTVDEAEDSTLADEVEEGTDDEDGDGMSDATDTDDDNDGTSDEQDADDDGDGVNDGEDADEDPGDAAADEGGGDEEGGDEGGGDEGGSDDGGGDEGATDDGGGDE